MKFKRQSWSMQMKLALNYNSQINHVEYLAIQREELGTANYLQLRQLKSKELLEKMKRQLEIDIDNTPPKSPFGKSLKYLSNNWISLQKFLENPKIKLDIEEYAIVVQ